MTKVQNFEGTNELDFNGWNFYHLFLPKYVGTKMKSDKKMVIVTDFPGVAELIHKVCPSFLAHRRIFSTFPPMS